MLLAISLASPLHAQGVRGIVMSGEGGQTIEGAAVSLLDSSGIRVGGMFSDASGRFAVRAPGPGRYSVRAVRIGYRPTHSALVALDAGQVVELTLSMQPVPVELPAVVTRGDDRCVIRPEEGLAVARAWEAARTGLDAALLLQEEGLVHTTVVRFERTRRLNGKISSEQSWTLRGQGANPFQSVSPESLAVYGYSRTQGDSTTYFAPDAAALLSDEFTDRHCFRLEAAADSQPGLVGLAFKPPKLGKHLDIEGVIWLDRSTSELRYLDFHYTMQGPDPLDKRLGGRIDFEQLVNGATIVNRWIIRMPIRVAGMTRQRGEFRSGGVTRLAAIQEAGGEVTELRSANGRSLSRSSIASPTGTMHDSIQVDVSAPGSSEEDAASLAGTVAAAGGSPIAGVRVSLDGTERSATTDSLGHFLLSKLPLGSQTVEVRRVGFAPVRRAVELRRGDVTQVDVTLTERVVTIDSVQVVGRPANADPTGFLRRRKQIGGDHFFDHSEIESLATQKLSDVLRMTPAVNVSSSGDVSVRRNVHNSVLSGCSIQYFVDGDPYTGNLDDFRPADIEYMEVYAAGSSVPTQFGGARAGCGVIALWTRRASGVGKPR